MFIFPEVDVVRCKGDVFEVKGDTDTGSAGRGIESVEVVGY